MIDLELLTRFYRELLDHQVFTASFAIGKALCVIFVVINYTQKYIKLVRKGDKLDIYDILRPIIYIAILISYTDILNLINYGAVTIENEFKGIYANVDALVFDLSDKKEIIVDNSADAKTKMQILFMEKMDGIAQFFANPFNVFHKLILRLAYEVDTFIYSFFLMLRFSMLLILRVIAPFAIVASIYDKFRLYFFNWARYYGLIWFWLIIFWIINIICTLFYTGITAVTTNPILSQASQSGASHFSGSLFMLIVVLKIILYKQSTKKVLTQIFTSPQDNEK